MLAHIVETTFEHFDEEHKTDFYVNLFEQMFAFPVGESNLI